MSARQIYRIIIKVAQELDLVIGFDGWTPKADLSLGAKLLSVMDDCSDSLVEVAKLSVFFESLLTNHSLETMVAATMNSIQPRGGNTINDFSAINTWFVELDKRYNFSIGPIVAALSNTDQLKQLKKLDPPFLEDFNGTSKSYRKRISYSSHSTGRSK